MDRLHNVMNKMQIQIVYNQSRRDYLHHLWDADKELYALELKKSKKAEDVAIYKRLDDYDKPLTDLMLRLYLDQCKSRHSLAFFQYRGNDFIPGCNSIVRTKLAEIFCERADYMQKVMDVMTKLTTASQSKRKKLKIYEMDESDEKEDELYNSQSKD